MALSHFNQALRISKNEKEEIIWIFTSNLTIFNELKFSIPMVEDIFHPLYASVNF